MKVSIQQLWDMEVPGDAHWVPWVIYIPDLVGQKQSYLPLLTVVNYTCHVMTLLLV